MISTLRALFLGRLLREKVLLVALVLVMAILWLTNFAGRAASFMADQRHTRTTLRDQQRLLVNRGAVEKAFTPEFRNRLDAIVTFATLGRPEILKVVDKIVVTYERQQRLKADAAHDARMLARKRRQLDPAMRLVQRKA